MLFISKLLISLRGDGKVGNLFFEECYSVKSRLMILTGSITIGVSVAFWSVVPPDFMAGIVRVDVHQIYQVALP